MGALSFLLRYFNNKELQHDVFKYVAPMTIGFLAYASTVAFRLAIHNTITRVIVLASATLSFVFFKIPWMIPLLIVVGGFVTNLSDRRYPQAEDNRKKNQLGQYLVVCTDFPTGGIAFGNGT